ncbi:PREDICTED: LOW QUALITY PROTEIN: uncharacterized protein LOC106746034 [Dinoponera quadriceps]|uniref:X-box-binding protein 1 n=1 Tax=Dinoponera quadriceps TaxID=609295 RepID=A0A6P3XI46_DINQU|nr:PREDICTED: LOW QUALITY PROTEIN: uncharacterized protein LOC106746034 [Dinoponera quadriceps]
MSCAKNSLILALPKGSRKEFLRNRITRGALSKQSVIASILLNKAKMDARKLAPRQENVNDDDASAVLFKPADANSRSKRRRLDHLTWEEKLQRKKMKNRVAAQTSRDRKKAKLDELELTVRTLTQECVMLRSQNESLLNETKRLRKELDAKNREERYCTLCQARVHCVVPSLGSAVSPNDPLPQGGTTQSITPDANTRNSCSIEDPDPLPPLEELCGDLQDDDDYIERLEELAESLLREVNLEVQAAPDKSNEQVSVKDDSVKEPGHPEAVVGQTSENVEANRAGGGVGVESYLTADLTSSSNCHPVVCGAARPERSNAQRVVTVGPTTTPPLAIKTEVEIKQESEPAHDLETTFYGTYDEATNSITIIYPGEESADIGIQECVQEVSTDDGVAVDVATDVRYLTPPPPPPPPPPLHGYSAQFSPAYTCRTDTMSPASTNSDTDSCVVAQVDSPSSMDCGYESHDSPSVDSHCRYSHINDLWHENFRELFPALA